MSGFVDRARAGPLAGSGFQMPRPPATPLLNSTKPSSSQMPSGIWGCLTEAIEDRHGI